MVDAELVNETMTGGAATRGNETGSANLTAGFSAGDGEAARGKTGAVNLATVFGVGGGATGGADLAVGFCADCGDLATGACT